MGLWGTLFLGNPQWKPTTWVIYFFDGDLNEIQAASAISGGKGVYQRKRMALLY